MRKIPRAVLVLGLGLLVFAVPSRSEAACSSASVGVPDLYDPPTQSPPFLIRNKPVYVCRARVTVMGSFCQMDSNVFLVDVDTGQWYYSIISWHLAGPGTYVLALPLHTYQWCLKRPLNLQVKIENISYLPLHSQYGCSGGCSYQTAPAVASNIVPVTICNDNLC